MHQEIKKTIEVLKQGGIILYPTDTVWGIGCDATNAKAVAKIYKLKKRIETKAMICLVADDRMLKKYVKTVPDAAQSIFDIAEEPITIIYDDAQNLAQNLIAEDKTIAIRIPDDEFCYQICRKLNGAIVSTSANISGAPTPKSFKEISQEIIKGVDYVVNLHHEKKATKPSSIIKLSRDGIVKVIRK
ncbi:threonylcarbamoyl-AMP synthase [Lacinutrix sp. C3R15]|uniref:L-threonylcarbamoyladenylate synthase n=1 Tax=Flavobacteriaceae TaxID=49546 RepID=UPI001C083C85|nr:MULTISPECIES: L-threonylcarbamoyladenylate synthase [Flavobacteriaceae]MBU2940676.1 threonylcarbamoyl-AMP synthase [Lacinutrix sp. C3R15]MDO6623994.1 L-threonylcarbamoyladenylate synthase [Oceanihabitans sp. 1_MG-2023]